jgi:hypothetical protein
MNNDYNIDMGHVDVADQLRGNYRMDHWQRQYKWWWSVWLWGFGVLLVNAYVYYKKVMEEADSTIKKKRGSAIKDSTLTAITGAFCRRLDPTVGHWCIEVPHRPKCALHRWASGLEQTTNVYSCSFCCVTLCVECFKIFHTVKSYDLIKNKAWYKDHFSAKRAAKRLAAGK